MNPSVRTALGSVTVFGILALTACAGQTPSSPLTRADAESLTRSVQQRIVAQFPDEAVASDRTRDWTMLACSETEVSSAGGEVLLLTERIDVDATYGEIADAVRDDGYSASFDTTGDGTERLTLTGTIHDRYLVTIHNDTQQVRLSSFSPCYEGSLADR